MTQRVCVKLEYFAGKAMEALVANGYHDPENISKKAIKITKALITELNKEQ